MHFSSNQSISRGVSSAFQPHSHASRGRSVSAAVTLRGLRAAASPALRPLQSGLLRRPPAHLLSRPDYTHPRPWTSTLAHLCGSRPLLAPNPDPPAASRLPLRPAASPALGPTISAARPASRTLLRPVRTPPSQLRDPRHTPRPPPPRNPSLPRPVWSEFAHGPHHPAARASLYSLGPLPHIRGSRLSLADMTALPTSPRSPIRPHPIRTPSAPIPRTSSDGTTGLRFCVVSASPVPDRPHTSVCVPGWVEVLVR